MPLFNFGEFILSSGQESLFKIDCDVLSDDDWDTVSNLISRRFLFEEVFSVPTGGDKLAEACKKYITVLNHIYNDHKHVLLVDDVYTTGLSLEKRKLELENQGYKHIRGVVLFARKVTPGWVTPIFSMDYGFHI